MGQLSGRSFVDSVRLVEGQMPSDPETRRGALLLKWAGSKYDLFGCVACGSIYRTDNHTVDVVDGKVTLSPSFGCPGCGAHFYVRDGQVQMLDFSYG